MSVKVQEDKEGKPNGDVLKEAVQEAEKKEKKRTKERKDKFGSEWEEGYGLGGAGIATRRL